MTLTLAQRAAAISLLPQLSPVITSITMAQAFAQEYDERIDWHEFSRLLDFLHCRTLVKVVGFTRDMQTIYALNTNKLAARGGPQT